MYLKSYKDFQECLQKWGIQDQTIFLITGNSHRNNDCVLDKMNKPDKNIWLAILNNFEYVLSKIPDIQIRKEFLMLYSKKQESFGHLILKNKIIKVI